MEADSRAPAPISRYARLEPDKTKARAALEKAVKMNPKAGRAARAHGRARDRSGQEDRSICRPRVKLDARNAASWQALAEAYLAEHKYGDAAKAWRSAEQAATAMRIATAIARRASPSNSSAWITKPPSGAAQEAEKQREIERLKAEARAQLHGLEAKANQGGTPPPKSRCPGGTAQSPPAAPRHAEAGGLPGQAGAPRWSRPRDKKTLRLLFPTRRRSPSWAAASRRWAAAASSRAASSSSTSPRPNAKLATAGEVATIEFQ